MDLFIRFIDNFNHWHTSAFYEFGGKKLIMWDAELLDEGEVFLLFLDKLLKLMMASLRLRAKVEKSQFQRAKKMV